MIEQRALTVGGGSAGLGHYRPTPIKSPLTNKSSPSMRRADLLDPTPAIDRCVLF